MAQRTTTDSVSALVSVPPARSAALQAAIDTATIMVDEHCANAGYSTGRLELIERWLSAHYFAVAEQQVQSEQARGTGAAYQVKIDMGLHVTHYGQQAMTLDHAGGLSSANQQAVNKDGRGTNFDMFYGGEYDHRDGTTEDTPASDE